MVPKDPVHQIGLGWGRLCLADASGGILLQRILSLWNSEFGKLVIFISVAPQAEIR